MGQRSHIFLILISFTLASASADDVTTSPPNNSNSGAYLTDSAETQFEVAQANVGAQVSGHPH